MINKILKLLKFRKFTKKYPFEFKRGHKVYKIKSTKSCPICNNTKLLLLTSLKEKICTDCNLHFNWELNKHQKSLY